MRAPLLLTTMGVLVAVLAACKVLPPPDDSAVLMPEVAGASYERQIPSTADRRVNTLAMRDLVIRDFVATGGTSAEAPVRLFKRAFARRIESFQGLSRAEIERILAAVVQPGVTCGIIVCSKVLGTQTHQVERFVDAWYLEVKFADDPVVTARQRQTLVGSLRPSVGRLAVNLRGLPDGFYHFFVLNFVNFEGQRPLGMEGGRGFLAVARLARRLLAALYPDSQLFIEGSSVSGRKYVTGAPFDEGRVSDYDMALTGPAIVRRTDQLGLFVRGGKRRSSPLNLKGAYRQPLWQLGLEPVLIELTNATGREVSFMIYRDYRDILERATPHILVTDEIPAPGAPHASTATY